MFSKSVKRTKKYYVCFRSSSGSYIKCNSLEHEDLAEAFSDLTNVRSKLLIGDYFKSLSVESNRELVKSLCVLYREKKDTSEMSDFKKVIVK